MISNSIPLYVRAVDPRHEHGGPTICGAHTAAPGKTTPDAPYVVGRLAIHDGAGAVVCPRCILPAIRDGRARLVDPDALRAFFDGAGRAERELLDALLAAHSDAGRADVERLRAALAHALRRGGDELAEVRRLLGEVLTACA